MRSFFRFIGLLCKVILGLLLAMALTATAIGVMNTRDYMNRPIALEQARLITVKEGSNYNSFTKQLVDEELIAPSFWSRVAGRLYPKLQYLKAGTYEIPPAITLAQLFEIARSGKEHQFAVTFVEGTTFSQWRKQLAETPYLTHQLPKMDSLDIVNALGLSHNHLEGLFLPETYHYVAGETDLVILQRAAQALTRTLNEAWESRQADLPLTTPYELLILASIIEKETGIKYERGKVASVFINRLNKKMRLQTDPTVIYGMGERYAGNISRADLREATPYNTYVIDGLPPTPIAMTGKASIHAAANPEETTYLYFVAKGPGGHQFSNTLAEHNRAVADYLQYLKKQK